MKKTTKTIILSVLIGLATISGAILGIRYYRKSKKKNEDTGGETDISNNNTDTNKFNSGNNNNITVDNSNITTIDGLNKGSNKPKQESEEDKKKKADIKRINEIGNYLLDNYEFKNIDDAKWYFPTIWKWKENSSDFVKVSDELLGRALSKFGLVRFDGIKQRLSLKQAFDIYFKYINKDNNGKNPYILFNGGFDKPDLSIFPKRKLEELATNGYWLSLVKEEQYHHDNKARELFEKYTAGSELFDGQFTNRTGYLFKRGYICVIADVDMIVKYGSFATYLVHGYKQYRWNVYYHNYKF